MTINLTSHKTWNKRDGWKLITPMDALGLLEGGAANRPLREYRAQRLAGQITAGKWAQNGESIVFDDRDRMIDGQHRMRACVLADQPIIAYCVFDVSGKVFSSIDQGDKRQGQDLAALLNFRNSALVSAVTRIALQIADGSYTTTGANYVSPSAMTAYMERHRTKLQHTADYVSKFKDPLRRIAPQSNIAYVYYTVHDAVPDKAVGFVEKIALGENLKKGDAILLFRARMLDLSGVTHKLDRTGKLALTIKAWNSHCSGKKVSLLRWKREVETFPLIEIS